MSENNEFLYQRKPIKIDKESADDKFDVAVPKKNLIIYIAIFAILFFAQFYYFSGLYYKMMFPSKFKQADFPYAWVPLVFLAIAVVVILAWGNIGSRFASSSMLAYLKRTTTKSRLNPAEIILGFPMRTKDIYYLEAFPVDLDLGGSPASLKIFIKRVMETMFLSMGMSVMIATYGAPYLYANHDIAGMYFNIEELIIDMTLYLGPLTLLILMLVEPVFWMAEDVQAYRITPNQDSVRLGLFLRSGILSKILSFFGIILVYNLASAFATALLGGKGGNSVSVSNPGSAIAVYTTTFMWFGLILAMSAAMPFFIAFVYLAYYHERWVNNVRVQASEFMPIGTLQVVKPGEARFEYLKKPDKVDKTGAFLQTPHGRIILLALIIASAIVCIYLAFIMGFEAAIFPS